ncbi:MAG: cytochrome c [Thiohalomonadales bacterium]
MLGLSSKLPPRIGQAHQEFTRGDSASVVINKGKKEDVLLGGTSEWHEAGRKIYNFRCYFCHGYSGDAKTLAASFLDPQPRNFQKTSLRELSRQKMLDVLSHGVDGTAMTSFANTLSTQDIERVVDFVRKEFIQNKAKNTRYHTKENGWDNHQRYRIAFPFATGEIALDTPDDELDEKQLAGKQLFMSSCITCHDRAKVNHESLIWQARAVSYPRNQYSHKTDPKLRLAVDAKSGASLYARHDIAPKIEGLGEQEKAGEKLFQANCAFCHAADGTGKNWIGSFLQDSPRNLTDAKFMQAMTRERLRKTIEDGLENTTMPAWKNVLTPKQIDDIIAYVSRVFHELK